MSCPRCGGAPSLGVLCAACAAAAPPPPGFLPEHVRTDALRARAAGWLIDGFGASHPLGPGRTLIGRRPPADLLLLSASVSREHAELVEAEGGWMLRDLGSRNGVEVDRVRVQGRQELGARALVRIGEVTLIFIGEPLAIDPQPALSIATGHAGAAGVFRFVVASVATELCLVGVGGQEVGTTGGALLHRARGAESWAELSLPPLEFQLLATLCRQALAEARSPSPSRGCVATRQLAKELPFQSRYANEENVRQVVRRLRTTLAALGADELIEAAPGRGYFVRWPVTVG